MKVITLSLQKFASLLVSNDDLAFRGFFSIMAKKMFPVSYVGHKARAFDLKTISSTDNSRIVGDTLNSYDLIALT
jgi:hypothetical protein